MKPYDFVHLVIHAAGGHVRGRTRLQTTVYFVGILAEQIQNLGYRPHYYGPFSPAVAGAIQELRGLRFLEQRISPEETADESGFEMTRYDYLLTDAGKQVAEEKATLWPEEWARIADAVRRLESSEVKDYVRLAIAAKTDLVRRHAEASLPPEALKAKAAEHGWKAFTDRQYAEALNFLETVVNPQPRPATA